MKAMVISYSLTGNNRDLAASLAQAIGAEHARVAELKSRKMGKIVLDILFKRTPKINMPVESVEAYDLVLFVGPVWMGHVATPFRACFQQLAPTIGDYGYISISGGADGPNPNLADELTERLGREPAHLIDLHIADLLPSEPKPTRDDTMAYRINGQEVKHLTDTVLATLGEVN
jgi:flavodoxin